LAIGSSSCPRSPTCCAPFQNYSPAATDVFMQVGKDLQKKMTQTKNEQPTGGRSVFLSDFFDGLLITDGSGFGASPLNRSFGAY
jgi:hypothetical protein